MRFFKKNQSPAPTESSSQPKQEDLKQAWEDLQAQENSESEQAETGGLEGKSFIGGVAAGYKEPEFKANLTKETTEVDVTPRQIDTFTQHHEAAAYRDDEIPTPSTFTREKGADLNAMRLDVARISADIQSGEELYRRAQKRIDNLTSFVEHAEVDFSLLNRLEPENRRLKARLRTLESEFDDKARRIALLEGQVEDQNSRILERNKAFDETQSKLALAKSSLREYERSLKTAQDSADRHALAAERAETALDVEKRENEVLRNKLVDITVTAEEKQSDYLEARKIADSLTQDCEDFRNQSETAKAEVLELRNALDETTRQNMHMKSELVQLHEDIRSFKTEYEYNMVTREDEIISMQSQIHTLQKQLDVKDEIVRNAARDVTELRKIRAAQDIERERLENLVESQNYQLDETRSELMRTQQDVSDFDRRYKDVATALSVSQARRSSNPPADIPDIQPRVTTEQVPLKQDVFSQDLVKPEEELSEDEIIGRITDFKLGNRSDIA